MPKDAKVCGTRVTVVTHALRKAVSLCTWLANVRRAVGVTTVTHALLKALALGGPLRFPSSGSRFEHAGVLRSTSMSLGELIIRR